MPTLLSHPHFPPSRVSAVSVRTAWESMSLTFLVEGGEDVLFPAPAPAIRTDGLWQTTCFELFVKPEGSEGYFEFNFSPSGAWAAYAFDSYRSGMRELEIAAPQIRCINGGAAVTVDLSALPQGPWRVGVSAVVEEQGGEKSYWALTHPPGKPDFHHADCFALELPAASAT